MENLPQLSLASWQALMTFMGATQHQRSTTNPNQIGMSMNYSSHNKILEDDMMCLSITTIFSYKSNNIYS
jgi:hypothetical protein